MIWNAVVRVTVAAVAAMLLASCAQVGLGGTVLEQADRAMGGASLKTLHYAGSGTGATFGQAYQPGHGMAEAELLQFLARARLRERRLARRVRAQPRPRPRGAARCR